jgi:alpha-tubulin suppressor-like RCC1 family protein
MDHTCVILDDGLVRCWGSNESGQLGAGDMLPRGNVGGLNTVSAQFTPVDLKF